MKLHNLENNLFKLILVGLFLMGISIIIPNKNIANLIIAQAQAKPIISKSEPKIQQVFVVGKRLNKNKVMLAAK